ncbi:hypothetical protein VE00_02453 [Pseudogymnoascus sp. WSF 3629]|nr:hypothetical protein VE00_02453 [Pseudogymnoascus sp. WSF 3629]
MIQNPVSTPSEESGLRAAESMGRGADLSWTKRRPFGRRWDIADPLGSNRGTMPRKGKRRKGDHDGIFSCFIEKLRSRTSIPPMVCFSQIQHNAQRITPIVAGRAPQGNGGGLSGRTHLVAGVIVLLAKYGERATAGR